MEVTGACCCCSEVAFVGAEAMATMAGSLGPAAEDAVGTSEAEAPVAAGAAEEEEESSWGEADAETAAGGANEGAWTEGEKVVAEGEKVGAAWKGGGTTMKAFSLL